MTTVSLAGDYVFVGQPALTPAEVQYLPPSSILFPYYPNREGQAVEFKLWGTGTTVLITPQAIDMAVETEHLEQKTVRLLTPHGDVIVLDPDRTVMAQIENAKRPTFTLEAKDNPRLALSIVDRALRESQQTLTAMQERAEKAEALCERLEIDLAYERQERKVAEGSVAPLKAYVEQLQMLNDGLRHDMDELLAGDPAIEIIREARAWAGLWKRAAKRNFTHQSDRILLRMLHSAEAQAKRGEIVVT